MLHASNSGIAARNMIRACAAIKAKYTHHLRQVLQNLTCHNEHTVIPGHQQAVTLQAESGRSQG